METKQLIDFLKFKADLLNIKYVAVPYECYYNWLEHKIGYIAVMLSRTIPVFKLDYIINYLLDNFDDVIIKRDNMHFGDKAFPFSTWSIFYTTIYYKKFGDIFLNFMDDKKYELFKYPKG